MTNHMRKTKTSGDEEQVSQAQEVQRGTKNDIPLFIITFSLMVSYISFALFRINLIRSKVTLGESFSPSPI